VPLLLSITSTGDVATKFAFPAGQWISPHRPKLNKIEPPDVFGIESDKTYYLLTTANTVALQNHLFQQRPADSLDTTPSGAYSTVCVSKNMIFDYLPLDPSPRNNTPYWVSQLPQVFVPDHGEVFGFQFMNLISTFLLQARVMEGSSPLCGESLPKPPVTRQRGSPAMLQKGS
jgi:hypothetical protein